MEKETKQTLSYDVSTIIDLANCCKELVDNKENVAAQYTLATFLEQAFKMSAPVYITGIGKPSYVAMKAAASLKSVMIDAQYLDAITAGHGDLGSIPVDKPSALIAMSKSGCSNELYTLFEALHSLRPNCTIVMLCMSNDEQYDKVKACKAISGVCRLQLDPKELDGYGIVPSVSNAAFEIVLSNAFSVALNNAFGAVNVCERLQKSHPSGTLQTKVTKLLDELRAKQEQSEQTN